MSHDTVERLMELADEYAIDRAHAIAKGGKYYEESVDESRDALKAALVDAIDAGAHRAPLATEPKAEQPAEDARRYRWLRDHSGVDLRSFLGVSDFCSLDAHIDAAMSANGDKK